MDLQSLQFKAAIVRLSPFHDVVKSITHQFLYGECRKVLQDNNIDFFFLPPENKRRSNLLTSSRFHYPLSEFDIVLISNSFTSELVNLPWILKHSNIPCRNDERSINNTKPIIIMGGSNALASQSILYSDDTAMVDALFIGEGECQTARIIQAIAESSPEQRRATLVSLQGTIPGLKVFGAGSKQIDKAVYSATKTEQLANAEQYLFDSSEATTARLFIAYGCPSFCTFCFEGWEHKPYREIPAETLIKSAESLRYKTGADTLEITAFNFNTHKDMTLLMKELAKRFFRVNFMSQRADILASIPSLAHYELVSGKRQYTLGIEGISERMRSYFNKNLNEEIALKALTQLLKEPVREIKLFYIISGLETEADNNDFKQFLNKTAQLCTLYNSGVRILCSFGLLVRMPFTPLRYERLLLTENEWKPVVGMIRQSTESAGYEFRLTYPYEEYFLSQTLALTTEFCAPTLEEMAENNMIYDEGFPEGTWDFFTKRIPVKESFCEEKPETYQFAFNFVNTHISNQLLYKRFCNAKKAIEAPLCLGTSCTGCGACSHDQQKVITTHTITIPTIRDCEEIAAIEKAKAQSKPIYVSITIPDSLEHAHEETKTATVLRLLFKTVDNGMYNIMTVRDVLFGSSKFEGKLPHWSGTTQYAVYPFTNSTRKELFTALQKAGFNPNDVVSVKDNITVSLFSRTTKTIQDLEKTAGCLLDSMHLQHTLSRKDGISYFSIAPKALKKHIIKDCRIENQNIIINCTEKIDLSFIQKSDFAAHFYIEKAKK